MIYTLEENKLDLKAKGVERILQNCVNILSTMRGEVVLERNLGVDGSIVDTPLNRAKGSLDIKKQLETYEPRVRVENITYEVDHLNGVLKPKVEVRIIE